MRVHFIAAFFAIFGMTTNAYAQGRVTNVFAQRDVMMSLGVTAHRIEIINEGGWPRHSTELTGRQLFLIPPGAYVVADTQRRPEFRLRDKDRFFVIGEYGAMGMAPDIDRWFLPSSTLGEMATLADQHANSQWRLVLQASDETHALRLTRGEIVLSITRQQASEETIDLVFLKNFSRHASKIRDIESSGAIQACQQTPSSVICTFPLRTFNRITQTIFPHNIRDSQFTEAMQNRSRALQNWPRFYHIRLEDNELLRCATESVSGSLDARIDAKLSASMSWWEQFSASLSASGQAEYKRSFTNTRQNHDQRGSAYVIRSGNNESRMLFGRYSTCNKNGDTIQSSEEYKPLLITDSSGSNVLSESNLPFSLSATDRPIRWFPQMGIFGTSCYRQGYLAFRNHLRDTVANIDPYLDFLMWNTRISAEQDLGEFFSC